MANLAIKGHATRGKEVIEILEMLGGSNPHNYCADCDSLCFTIGKSTNIIYYDWVKECYEDEDTLVFTLEEFLEKFPYKVGDKVSSKYLKNYEVSKMEWESANNRVIYKLQGMGWYSPYELQPYKEETMEEEGTLVKIDLTREMCVADEVEVILGDYEFVLKDGKTYFIKKKPKYPKTYEECCKVLMGKTDLQDYSLLRTKLSTKINEANSISLEPPHITLINNLYKLLICRDAYWKIAGDQMGLGKPWKPDWLNVEQDKFVLYTHDDVICLNRFVLGHNVLAFPTAEIRDAFLDNFKELINKTKELL